MLTDVDSQVTIGTRFVPQSPTGLDTFEDLLLPLVSWSITTKVKEEV